MYNICDMCYMYGKCTCATLVTGVTHIAHETHATSRTPILHMICVTVDAVTDNKDTSGTVLVQSCGAAGVATGDGRHQPFPPCQEAPELDDGCAIRYASVHWTPSAPVKSGCGMFNTACRVSPRPIRTVSLVQVVFDEPPPGRTAIGSSPHRGRSGPSRHAEGASVLHGIRKLRCSPSMKVGFAAPARRTLHLPSDPGRSQARRLIGRKGALESAGAPATPPAEFLPTH